ncbi:MAG: hypothetical protein WD426_17760 [Anditalea sp.]
MIETVCLVAGIFLILLIFLDILFTTFSMEGGGKMTDLIMKKVWQVFLLASGHNGTNKVLNYAGLWIMVILILFWGLSIWIGVFLIFASQPTSVIMSGTGAAATLSEKFYYSGYVLTTMGLGDQEPLNGSWGIATSLFSFFGLVFITLMVSYILPVLSKIIEKKEFSLFVHHLGDSPQKLLLYFWNGKDFSRIQQMSTALQQRILHISQSHQAYPILHYFHAHKKGQSLEVSLCLIDEALSLILNQIAVDQWDEKDILPIRKALTNYLKTMEGIYSYKVNDKNIAPEPDLSLLSEEKVRMTEVVWEENQRKELWLELLRSKGWTWNEVYPT